MASEFWKRLCFTFLMGESFLALIYGGVVPCLVLVLVVQARMFHEILAISQRERKEQRLPYFRYLPWYFLTITMSFFTLMNLRPQLERSWPATATPVLEYLGFGAFVLTVIGFCAFVLTLRKGWYRYQFSQFTWVVCTLLFINIQGSLLVPNMLHGMIWFLLPTSCVVMNDTWAYACGKMFGRTRLLKLSPKKTLEGFIGAALFTVAWAWWFASFLSNFPELICPKSDFVTMPMTCTPNDVYMPVKQAWFNPNTDTTVEHLLLNIVFNYNTDTNEYTYRPIQLHALGLAFFASVVAPFGGFFASGLKRAFKLKDFSDLIPGHGGMTDRMDCQLIMGVFTYIYYVYFIRGIGGGFGGGGPSSPSCPSSSSSATVALDFMPCLERLTLDNLSELQGLISTLMSEKSQIIVKS
eukprot:PhM_4_TR9328/c0_g1_i1/m.20865/K00981/E2.7.7.41, CDS1, CDS2, cdsA; phosphatidate cytidylyltransferase